MNEGIHGIKGVYRYLYTYVPQTKKKNQNQNGSTEREEKATDRPVAHPCPPRAIRFRPSPYYSYTLHSVYVQYMEKQPWEKPHHFYMITHREDNTQQVGRAAKLYCPPRTICWRSDHVVVYTARHLDIRSDPTRKHRPPMCPVPKKKNKITFLFFGFCYFFEGPIYNS